MQFLRNTGKGTRAIVSLDPPKLFLSLWRFVSGFFPFSKRFSILIPPPGGARTRKFLFHMKAKPM